MPTLSFEKRRGRNWVLRPICMCMLVMGFWIPGQRSTGIKISSFYGQGVLLGPPPASPSSNWPTQCRDQLKGPNSVSGRTGYGTHSRYGGQGPVGTNRTMLWWSKVSCRCETKSPGGSWNQCSNLRSEPRSATIHQGDPDQDLYLSESQSTYQNWVI